MIVFDLAWLGVVAALLAAIHLSLVHERAIGRLGRWLCGHELVLPVRDGAEFVLVCCRCSQEVHRGR